MTDNMATRPISERFNHLYNLISSERFFIKQGLDNDIPFFICPYKPGESAAMQGMIDQLANRLSQSGLKILEINLYDLSIEILKENGDWEWYLKEETSMSKQELKEELQSILDIETVLVPGIAQKMKKDNFDLMFLSGAGEVFPYIRSHNVLNNLQSIVKDIPVLMFFPGEYTYSPESGASLELFGRLHDDKYYRAFNIYHCEI
ncbi:DUF1788 domain-containing protein [Desulfobacterales bacterium HSG17]|nr:DUF1788 domain-containing protein [Desulfobacterales bacterium HSG17]